LNTDALAMEIDILLICSVMYTHNVPIDSSVNSCLDTIVTSICPTWVNAQLGFRAYLVGDDGEFLGTFRDRIARNLNMPSSSDHTIIDIYLFHIVNIICCLVVRGRS